MTQGYHPFQDELLQTWCGRRPCLSLRLARMVVLRNVTNVVGLHSKHTTIVDGQKSRSFLGELQEHAMTRFRFNTIDTDRDGVISRDEAEAYAHVRVAREAVEPPAGWFEAIDTNANDLIDDSNAFYLTSVE